MRTNPIWWLRVTVVAFGQRKQGRSRHRSSGRDARSSMPVRSQLEIREELHAIDCCGVGKEIQCGVFHGFEIYRDLFARGAGVHRALLVAQLGFGFPEATAVRLQAGDADEFLADGDFVDETDVEFGSKAELFLGGGGSPEHGFVEDGGEYPAVDDAAEAGVRGLRREVGADFIAVAVEAEAQAVWIVRTADEAVTRVGKCECAHFMKTLSKRPAR